METNPTVADTMTRLRKLVLIGDEAALNLLIELARTDEAMKTWEKAYAAFGESVKHAFESHLAQQPEPKKAS